MRRIAILFFLCLVIPAVAYSWDSYAELTGSRFTRTDGTTHSFDATPPDSPFILYLTNDKIEEAETFRIFRNSVLSSKGSKEISEIFLVCRETDTAVIERYTKLNDILLEKEPKFDENTILLLNKEELDRKLRRSRITPKPRIYFHGEIRGTRLLTSFYGFNDFWDFYYREMGSEEPDRQGKQESVAEMKRALPLIDEGGFKERIWDYERHSSWQYDHDRPAIVMIGAGWCGPCLILQETMEKLNADYGDTIDFFLIDSDKESNLSNYLHNIFGQYSIPFLLFCLSGRKPTTAVGAVRGEDLVKFIEENMLR